MRRLMLLRHAKAAMGSGLDIDRPLAPKGREAAPLIGAYLRDEQLFPDLALVSPAKRARETWDLVQPALGEVDTRLEEGIYDAPPARLLALAQTVEPSVRTLLMVGHNPGFHDLAKMLVGHGDRYAFARLNEKYPTAGLAVIDFSVEGWSELGLRGGRLDRFVTPKSLGAGEDD